MKSKLWLHRASVGITVRYSNPNGLHGEGEVGVALMMEAAAHEQQEY